MPFERPGQLLIRLLQLAVLLVPLQGLVAEPPSVPQEKALVEAGAPEAAAPPSQPPTAPAHQPVIAPTPEELLERLLIGELETRHQLARKEAGLESFMLDPELREASQAFAEGHCTQRADISHSHRLPNGLNLWSFYPRSRFQLLERWGNNLGRIDFIVHGAETVSLPPADQVSSQLMRGWLNSPGHRANILGRSFTHMGIGITLCKLKPGHLRVYAVGGFVRVPQKAR